MADSSSTCLLCKCLVANAPLRTLNCSHAFCDTCLGIIRQTTEPSTPCPECNRSVPDRVNCRNHPEEKVSLFCDDPNCKHPICTRCLGAHLRHAIILIEEAANKQVSSSIQQAAELLQEAQQQEELTTTTLHDLELHCDEVNRALTRIGEQAKQALNRALEIARSKVNEYRNQQTRALQSHLSVIKSCKKELDTRVKSLQHAQMNKTALHLYLVERSDESPLPKLPSAPPQSTLYLEHIPHQFEQFQALVEQLTKVVVDKPYASSFHSAECASCNTMLSSGIDGIISSMCALPYHHCVQENALASLKVLSYDQQDLAHLIDKQVIQLVLDAIRNHPTNRRLIEDALRTLITMLHSEQAIHKILQHNGIDILITAMKTHLAHASIQEGSMRILHCAVTSALSGECQRVIAASVTNAMKAHPDHDVVQERGCGILHTIACGGIQGRDIMLMLNGTEVVVSAMRACSTHAGVLTNGCGALACLTQCADGIQQAIGYNATAYVLKAMKSQVENASVQCTGCAVLRNVIDGAEERCKEVVSQGGIEAAIHGMNAHVENADVQLRGCELLCVLTDSKQHDNHAQYAVTEGGVEAVLTGMKTHRDNVDIQCSGCTALSNMTGSRDGAERLLREEGLSIIVAAMQKHDHEKMQLCGCRALENVIAHNKQSKQLFRDGGGLDAVIAAMRRYPCYVEMQERACHALLNYAQFTEEVKTLVEKEVVEVVIAIVRDHDKEEWAEVGKAILRKVDSTTSGHTKLVSANALDLVKIPSSKRRAQHSHLEANSISLSK